MSLIILVQYTYDDYIPKQKAELLLCNKRKTQKIYVYVSS